MLLIDGDMFADIHRQRGFAHGRSGGQNDQFAVVQTTSHLIEFGQSCFSGPVDILISHSGFHAVHGLVQHIRYVLDRLG